MLTELLADSRDAHENDDDLVGEDENDDDTTEPFAFIEEDATLTTVVQERMVQEEMMSDMLRS